MRMLTRRIAILSIVSEIHRERSVCYQKMRQVTERSHTSVINQLAIDCKEDSSIPELAVNSYEVG